MRDLGPDRLIVRRAPYDLVADAMVEAAACPIIGEINAVSFLEAETYFGRRYDRFEKRRQLTFYRRCHRLSCVTAEVKAQLESLGLPGGKMVVVPNGVDTAMFHPGVAKAEGVLEPLGPVDCVVGYCASVTPLHDLGVAVAAMQGLTAGSCGLPAFLFVGPGTGDLIDAGAGKELLARSVAMGRVPHVEVPALMAHMDVGCVALRGTHQSPLKVMEFMAMGVPVAAAADGSGLASLKEAGAGLVTPAGDAAALGASLERLLARPHLRSRLGAAGADWVREHGTWRTVAARMIGEE
jgi:glycosyltransferase involved in cell wall biosynthesis